jgi:fumarylpyruvate hydrolase
MGGDPETDPPFFFMKPAGAIVQNGGTMPYPPGTGDLQHEVELVVAMNMGGRNIPPEKASDMIIGYAVGLDMTKRDVQTELKKKGRPWEMAKAFDFSAPCSAIALKTRTGVIAKGKIECRVNGQLRQSGDLGGMIWEVPQIIHYLSRQVEVCPGDLIFTGTPAGVGPVVKGDKIEATIAGLAPLSIEIG